MARDIRFCRTFLHVARVKKPTTMRESQAILAILAWLNPKSYTSGHCPTERADSDDGCEAGNRAEESQRWIEEASCHVARWVPSCFSLFQLSWKSFLLYLLLHLFMTIVLNPAFCRWKLGLSIIVTFQTLMFLVWRIKILYFLWSIIMSLQSQWSYRTDCSQLHLHSVFKA